MSFIFNSPKAKCGTDIASRRRLNPFVCPAEVPQKAKQVFCVLLACRHKSKCLALGGVSGCNPLLKVVLLCGLNNSFNFKLTHSGTGLYAFSLVHLIRYPSEKLCAEMAKQHQFRDPGQADLPDTAKPLHPTAHHMGCGPLQ